MKRHKVLIVILLGISMFLAGCGGLKIRASDAMYERNPVKKIAVVAEGRVFYPSPGRNEYLLALDDSKKSLDTLIAQTKDTFEKKGYEIVYSEPAGIGFHDPNMEGDWVVIDNSDSAENKWQVKNGDPVYSYPLCQQNQDFKNAVQNIFDHVQTAATLNQTATLDMREKINDLQVIAGMTGSDTICVNRIYGEKFTTARKVGDFATQVGVGILTGVLTGGLVVITPASTATEIVESHFTCVDASSGEVAWQHGIRKVGDPTDPGTSFVEGILEPFPPINTPMDKKYKM